MSSSEMPSKEDYDAAARLGLLAVVARKDLDLIIERIAELHPENNTFPAEVLLELAAEAIVESGASSGDPIQYEGLRDRYLPEFTFRGKLQQHKSYYALSAAAMIQGGIYPNLLDEAYGWGIEDMWRYALYALLAYARAASERSGRSLETVAAAIARRRGIVLSFLGDD